MVIRSALKFVIQRVINHLSIMFQTRDSQFKVLINVTSQLTSQIKGVKYWFISGVMGSILGQKFQKKSKTSQIPIKTRDNKEQMP